MPIGEDVPMLIPLSIVLSIFVFFLFSILISISDRNEVVRMSEAGINIENLLIDRILSNSTGRIDIAKLDSLGLKGSCSELSNLNLSMNYNVQINVSKTNTTDWWCWNNGLVPEGQHSQISKTVPVLGIDSSRTYVMEVDVIVSK